jgi:hypothetical protein
MAGSVSEDGCSVGKSIIWPQFIQNRPPSGIVLPHLEQVTVESPIKYDAPFLHNYIWKSAANRLMAI